MEWNDEQKKLIIDRLGERGVTGKCPMCGQQKLVLMDGYFNGEVVSNIFPRTPFPSGNMPTIAVICSQCGFVGQHAIGALDLFSVFNLAGKR